MSESLPRQEETDCSTTTDDKELTECPTCGREDFKNERGVKIHHKRTHGESITATNQCKQCGGDYEIIEYKADKSSFCGRECQHEWQGENWVGENHHNYSKVELTCEWCDSDYKKAPSQSVDSRFCSKDCHSNWKAEELVGEKSPTWNGGKVTVECEHCGSDYEVTPSLKDETRFCSTGCKHKWHSENLVGDKAPGWKGGLVETECANCGEIVRRKQNEYDRYENQFCSQECRAKVHANRFHGEKHPNWKENTSSDRFYKTRKWKEARNKVLKRDNYVCQGCGDENQLLVHHIIPRGGGGDDYALLNLVTLCRSCHQKWEGLYLRPDPRGKQ